MRKNPLDDFELSSLLDRLVDDPSFLAKKMFGGLAVYLNGLMVLVIMENVGDREYRGKKYNFDIWNGLCICTSREHHEFIKKLLPSAVPHPVLPKWLFLPRDTDGFEDEAQIVIRELRKGTPQFGIVPGMRKKAKKKKARQSR